MKTNELTGKLLDYWVARAENYKLSESGDFWDLPDKAPWDGVLRFYSISVDEWEPSANWAHGGPIIERERIQIGPPTQQMHRNGGPNGGWGESGFWSACTWHKGANGRRAIGHDKDSALVAAMRCYVRSKFGDEVPDDTGSRA